MVKNIALLGSTGSIGVQTLEVIDEHKDDFIVKIISGHKNVQRLLEQALKYKPEYVIVTHEKSYEILKKELSTFPIKVILGEKEIAKVYQEVNLDLVIGAISGAAGIPSVLAALELGIDVALANKETIVVAGNIVKRIQKKTGAKIIPVDSEHSAIFQCLTGHEKAVSGLLITASGGPFRNLSPDELHKVTPEMALNHPTWSMGNKITIDSATLMNKGLEIIEAHFLFNVAYENINAIIHPQSIVHSMVLYGDGSVLAHLGLPDMRVPIQYALTYPERKNNSFPKLDLLKIKELEFLKPDTEKFPCLNLAYRAGKIGYTMPAVLNAANEIAVELFMQKDIGFMDIPKLVEEVMQKHEIVKEFDFKDLLEVDKWARIECKKIKDRM
ncbi:1-deoxy-D-xylulose 5-phosphate reductoisomerase [Desulfonispora thiosulfatigenes DSM 11270]|uniref:1-deoxy-D-xylulose 5-phosphate reductoisomerase n=1 Tax=Desulfonispora thiosulfatigenes DSM 11270 TaxID=656914 RepID=A0A1W1VM47_DESTI|nr:1-deoxy-D-xylulose-5-phosphate reductoisomerase [Desulfonispora thiosulfatigenes]SMB94024.1 1-deoxy-D-xylulose 5-phosphate reductoisomerase [Desulfonispora thiosulfatigenes DSM 11270]